MFVAFWKKRTATLMAGAANSAQGPIEGPLPDGTGLVASAIYLSEVDAELNKRGWRREGNWYPVVDGYSASIISV